MDKYVYLDIYMSKYIMHILLVQAFVGNKNAWNNKSLVFVIFHLFFVV